MIIQLGKDRDGNEWEITKVDGPAIAPVVGQRWVGRAYRSRTFQSDGRYWKDEDDRWDLVEEVSQQEQRA